VQQVTDALERYVGAGDRDDPVTDPLFSGPEQRGVDAERHHVQLARGDLEVFGDVGCRRRRHRQQLGNLAGHLLLHLGKPVPATDQRLAPPLRGRHVQDTIARDRMVHRRHHRQAQFGEVQQPGAQALVVVHYVEVAESPAQQSGGAHREGARFREAGCPRRQQFEHVDAVADLARPRNAERIGLSVQVEAGHLRQAHARVEHLGVGLAGKHLDVMTEFDEAAREVPDVDPLAAAMSFAPVGQQGDAHGQRKDRGPVSWANRVTQ